MPLRSHGPIPDPVPLDLTLSSAHAEHVPQPVSGVSAEVAQAMAQLGITAGDLVTAIPPDDADPLALSYEESANELPPNMEAIFDGVMTMVEGLGPSPVESKVDDLTEAVGQLIHAVQIIGQQQQWVTDQVTALGPLFAQLDRMFAGAKSPADIFKALIGMRGKVISGDAAGEAASGE